MTYKHTSKDGLAHSNDKSLTDLWDNIVHAQAATEARWIEELRAMGARAAHPDDGWVDREHNEIQFAYPQFNDDPQVGDLIVLGWPDSYRIVEVTNIRQRKPLLGNELVAYYSFRELES